MSNCDNLVSFSMDQQKLTCKIDYFFLIIEVLLDETPSTTY